MPYSPWFDYFTLYASIRMSHISPKYIHLPGIHPEKLKIIKKNVQSVSLESTGPKIKEVLGIVWPVPSWFLFSRNC